MIPYKLSFSDISEVRMGSPFNRATVGLVGSFLPSMEGYDFQDVGFVFDDGKKCALSQWDLVDNEPRFKIWILNQENQRVSISPSIDGACVAISELNNELIVKSWSFDAAAKKGTTKELIIKLP